MIRAFFESKVVDGYVKHLITYGRKKFVVKAFVVE